MQKLLTTNKDLNNFKINKDDITLIIYKYEYNCIYLDT